MPTPRPRQTILASHLIFTGYAHWLANDPRGSGSTEIRKATLKPLGPLHPGRQSPQPPRQKVREFHRQAQPLLEHPTLWFDETARQTIAAAISQAAQHHGYTIWACAICSNHAHLVVRAHRHRSPVIWDNQARQAAQALHEAKLFPANHPVWSDRPYKVYIYTPQPSGKQD